MSYPWSVSASWKYRNGHWMALRWDGNQRQAKMLSACFRCIFWDNGWFGAPGTRFSQTLLKTQERVKTHTGAILVCLCCCVLPLLPDRAHSPEFLFFRSGSVFCLSESMKKIRFSSLWLAIPA
ncbi:TPA: hypothetical protein QH033_004894 [Escherichia coli]|nr:hypothetical protein [Escherichia coli]HDS6786229.1 hypothetical protein [Escherichia coli]